MNYITYRLILVSLLPGLVSVILYLADKKTPFGNINNKIKQLIFGIIFGAIAIIGTEFGVNTMGVTLNVRDAAPICAGLIFGAPAGIISGIIGGVERYLAASWGAGTYTAAACSVATVFAGVFSALLRKFLFENKKPSWYYGFAAGIITEVFHMLTAIITHTDDLPNVFKIVETATIPMAFTTAFSVTVAIIFISLFSKENPFAKKSEKRISEIFQNYLLTCVLIAFFFISLFTYFLQSGVSKKEINDLLKLNIEDVRTDIIDTSNARLLDITMQIADEINTARNTKKSFLEGLIGKYDIEEINVINTNGIIASSTNPNYTNFDMNSGEQSAEFLILLNPGVNKFVQEYRPTSYDSNTNMKYAGVTIFTKGFVQVAYDAAHFQKAIDSQIKTVAKNRHIGDNGYIVICDSELNIISNSNENNTPLITKKPDEAGNFPKEGNTFSEMINGEECYCMYGISEGYYIVGIIPKKEILFSKNQPVYINVFMEILIFTLLFIMVYYLIKKLIVNNIRKINISLSKITNGDLETSVDVRSNKEFAELSDDINKTVFTLKQYIAEADARIDKELEFAHTIQMSSLPHLHPYYNNCKEFDIWAGMKAAKEVGGDFYDFYMIDRNHIAILIADVSGKGIPAAMFMMTSKAMLKSCAENGMSVDNVLTHVNNELCQSNDAGMFVTVWIGIIDLKTGNMQYSVAGHNPPLIRKKGGKFEYLKSRAGFVLAGMEDVIYRKNELLLEQGDTIFLYTDGVTEATNSENELYGEERLLKFINSHGELSCEELCHAVKADVDSFVGKAPQFDDITMLCFTFKENREETKQ